LEVINDALRFKKKRDVVNGRDIMYTEHLFFADVTKHRDFGFGRRKKRRCMRQSTNNLLAF
jgi:hypothetical protein